MTTIFHNVSISLNADSPEEAYTKLCDLLGAAGEKIDWNTDTYTTDHDDTEHTTEKLFPLL